MDSTQYIALIFALQLTLNADDVVGLADLQHAIDLGGAAKQLDRARIAHAQVGIAVDGEIVDEDIGDREAAGRLDFGDGAAC